MQLHRYKNHRKYFSDGDSGYWGSFKNHRSYFWDICRPHEGLKQILQDVEVGPPSDQPKDSSKQELLLKNHRDLTWEEFEQEEFHLGTVSGKEVDFGAFRKKKAFGNVPEDGSMFGLVAAAPGRPPARC